MTGSERLARARESQDAKAAPSEAERLMFLSPKSEIESLLATLKEEKDAQTVKHEDSEQSQHMVA